MGRIPILVIEEVQQRAQLHCEACGLHSTTAMAFHHRKLRSQGGQDTAANLMWVHAACHNVSPWSIHQNPNRSKRLGHILYAIDDPETKGFTTTPDIIVLRA